MDARTFEDAQLPVAVPPANVAPIDLHRHVALFRRHFRLFAAIAALVLVLTVLITLEMTPRYSATAEVALDPRQMKVTDTQSVLSGLPADPTAVDTEVEVLKSRNLAEKIVNQLKLDQDPEFNSAIRPKPFWAIFSPKADAPTAAVLQNRHTAVIDSLLKHLKIARSGLSLAINITIESTSASKAALIANTFADRYLLEQLDAKFDATRRASDWLNSRLGGLKTQVVSAEAAVERYKAAHGLMALGGTAGAAAQQTITQQEISNINTQLASARAEQAEADAKLNTARQQVAKGSNGDDLAEALSSPVINQLRQQRAQISSQVADMEGRLGPRHPDMLKAQRQLADIDAQIQAEIRRLTSNLEAQAQVARQRTASINSSLASSRGELVSSNSASVELNELERNAESVRVLYQSFLDRFKQTTEQQGIEQSDARVVSYAKVPTKPSFPNVPLNIMLGILLAIGTAIGAVFLGESLESGLYTSEDVEKTIGLPHLGSVPLVSSVKDKKSGSEADNSPVKYVIDHPLSSFAEAFRGLRTSILFSKVGEPVKIVAVTSALPGEGKTTTCICLGRVVAMGGMSVVIVDCDLRRRTINRMFQDEPTVGLLEVLAGTATLDEALIFDEPSGAYFLPLSKMSYTPKDVFASQAMDKLLEELRHRFELVLLDTAPVLPVADTRVLAPKADVTMFLTRWKKTPKKAVEHSLRQLDSVGAYVAGIALTQMNMKDQARYGYGDAGYYYRSYNQYYARG